MLPAVARRLRRQRFHETGPVGHAGDDLPRAADDDDPVRQARRHRRRHPVADPRKRDGLPVAAHLRPDRRPCQAGKHRGSLGAGDRSALSQDRGRGPLPAAEVPPRLLHERLRDPPPGHRGQPAADRNVRVTAVLPPADRPRRRQLRLRQRRPRGRGDARSQACRGDLPQAVRRPSTPAQPAPLFLPYPASKRRDARTAVRSPPAPRP